MIIPIKPLARGGQAVVGFGEGELAAEGDEQTHEQGRPNGLPSTVDLTLSPNDVVVPVEGRKPDERGNLPAVERAEFGQLGYKRHLAPSPTTAVILN